MTASELFSTPDEHGATLRLWVPPHDEVESAARHAGFDCEPLSLLLDPNDDGIEVDLGTALAFIHPVWWRSPQQCRDVGDDECNCGRISLLEVLDGLTEPDLRQQAVDAHRQVMAEAWDHLWSGEALRSGAKVVGGACVDCIVGDEDHLAAVGAEAHELGAELGNALAAYHSVVVLGSSLYRTETPE